MNKMNFKQSGGFPLDTNVLDFMQESYMIFNALASLAGPLTIISGCEDKGSSITDGVVCVEGEVFKFRGGAKQATVFLKEEKTKLPFENGNSYEVENHRYITFGTSYKKSWSWKNFKRIDNLEKIMHDLLTHKHAWSGITGKPTTFPPEEHSHDWGGIKGKPASFPPAKHSHSYNDLTDKPNLSGGRIVVAGKVGVSPRRVLARYTGYFYVTYPYGHSDWGCEHRIVHNLGHTDYIVTGSALGKEAKRCIKFNCYETYADYCVIVTADDSSPNESDFMFQITSFK